MLDPASVEWQYSGAPERRRGSRKDRVESGDEVEVRALCSRKRITAVIRLLVSTVIRPKPRSKLRRTRCSRPALLEISPLPIGDAGGADP